MEREWDDVSSGDLSVADAEKPSAKVAGASTDSEDNVRKWNRSTWSSSRNRLRLK